MPEILPISALIATRNRSMVLFSMLKSLAKQSMQPSEIIIVDASEDFKTQELCQQLISGLLAPIIYHRANEIGAAIQRNQAMQSSRHDTVWFLDDDIILEPNCVERLWKALQSDPKLGGVNAMITNQRYSPPGKISSIVFSILNGRKESSYAGKCIGPACNLLPEDCADLPEVVLVEWLNTTCTLYRRKALPSPPFPLNFIGASLSEDLALSLVVSKKWRLANARTARIFHDSQPGDHKANISVLSRMELVNRHYVMTQILGRRTINDYFKLFLYELYQVMGSVFAHHNWKSFGNILHGKFVGIKEIAINSSL